MDRPVKQIRIALGHQSRVGKDSFADHAADLADVGRFAFAEELYKLVTAVQTTMGQPVEKDPMLLQEEGMLMRKRYGDDVWVNKLATRIDAANNDILIITDMRLPNEFEWAKKNGFKTVKIVRPDRPIDRDPNHISETALANHTFDFIITNDGTIEKFHNLIDDLIGMLMIW